MNHTFEPPVSRLLDAAEHLFGRSGIPATSIRDITSKAGMNLASVNYHFGSKENLVAAVLARRAGPVNAERLRLLDAIESSRAKLRVADILGAFVHPVLELQEKHCDFLRFMGRLAAEPDPAAQRILFNEFGPVGTRYLAALGRALPAIPRRDLWLRWEFVLGALIHTWTNPWHLEARDGHAAVAPRAVADKLIDFAAAGLRLPAAKGTKK